MSNAVAGPRYYLVTNDGPRAALQVCCHLGNLPPSIAVIADAFDFLRIPDGAKWLGFWYGPKDITDSWRNFWDERRYRGGLEPISAEEWDRIQAWADEHRRKPARALLYGEDRNEAAAAAMPGQPSRAEASASASVPVVNLPGESVKRKARWS